MPVLHAQLARNDTTLAPGCARDNFLNIKNVSRDDVLAAHRIPPQLMGIVPGNTGGFGAINPAARVFTRNEIGPLQERFRELSEWIGEKWCCSPNTRWAVEEGSLP